MRTCQGLGAFHKHRFIQAPPAPATRVFGPLAGARTKKSPFGASNVCSTRVGHRAKPKGVNRAAIPVRPRIVVPHLRPVAGGGWKSERGAWAASPLRAAQGVVQQARRGQRHVDAQFPHPRQKRGPRAIRQVTAGPVRKATVSPARTAGKWRCSRLDAECA